MPVSRTSMTHPTITPHSPTCQFICQNQKKIWPKIFNKTVFYKSFSPKLQKKPIIILLNKVLQLPFVANTIAYDTI